MDLASPAAGMWVAALWASLSLSFSACLRMDRRPSVRRKKLSIFATESKRENEQVKFFTEKNPPTKQTKEQTPVHPTKKKKKGEKKPGIKFLENPRL